MKIRFYILLFFIGSCHGIYSQISTGETPLSYVRPELINDSEIMTINLNTPNVTGLLSQDIIQGRSDGLWRDAVAVPVNVGVGDNGIGNWFDLGDDGKVWKLRLRAAGALSIELNLDQFHLPNGAKLFIYNQDRTEHIGAFTAENNKDYSKLSTHMIQGDACIIEYSEVNSTTVVGLVHIKDIAYRYRDFLRLDEGGGSQVCEIDVNCDEGQGWQEEKNSVVRTRNRIGNDFFWSSGTLVNNTDLDCKPYILTSLRTNINPYTLNESDEDDYPFYKYYFDYERSECGEGGGLDKSISGGFLRATSNDQGGLNGSDFALIEISEDIPLEYDPYWAGWNANSNPNTTSGVCIHHPMGDVKKVSTFNSVPGNADYGITNTHWRVFWDETTNGKGVTEIGSIGAPIFDSEGRVFGTLTAGGSSCDEVLPGASNNPDFFGKLSKHWIENPNPIQQKLRFWLDPAGTGLTLYNGSENPCAVGLEENKDGGFDVFPNPATEFINIQMEFKGNMAMNIFDASGRLVLHSFFQSGESQQDISGLSSGIYIISLISEGTTFSKKLIVTGR